MNDVCIKDCHACTLQEGVENKALCATLFLPAMLERLSVQIAKLGAGMSRQSPALNDVVLSKKEIVANQLIHRNHENSERED